MNVRRSMGRLVAVSLLLFVGSAPSRSEVSVELGLDPGVAGVFLGGGGEVPSPWPDMWSQVRLHVAPEQILNPDGDAREDGEPDFMINQSTGRPEVVWAMNVNGTYQIVHAEWLGAQWSSPLPLTSSPSDDLDPKLSVLPGGGLAVTWWRDGPTSGIYHAERPNPGAAFGAPVLVSDAGTPAAHSTLAAADTVTYVAYEETGGGFKTVVVEEKTGTGPFVPAVIATTSRGGCLDVRVHESGENVWVVWIDSDTHLGWSRMIAGGWEGPSFEAYAGEDDLDRARLRIKGKALR